jgi:hypothetical protein
VKQSDLDEKIYEVKSFIADKFKDIQMQSRSLKNVESEVKVKQTLIKIQDAITDIRRGYDELEKLTLITPDQNEPEETDDNNLGFSFNNF